MPKNFVNPNDFRQLDPVTGEVGGMSADFDVAIEEGATIVRIGSILFGER